MSEYDWDREDWSGDIAMMFDQSEEEEPENTLVEINEMRDELAEDVSDGYRIV